MFKIGDRVRVITADYESYDRQGEVKQIVSPYVNIELDDEQHKYEGVVVLRQYSVKDLVLIGARKAVPLPLPG